jgi:hypothetical protein
MADKKAYDRREFVREKVQHGDSAACDSEKDQESHHHPVPGPAKSVKIGAKVKVREILGAFIGEWLGSLPERHGVKDRDR